MVLYNTDRINKGSTTPVFYSAKVPVHELYGLVGGGLKINVSNAVNLDLGYRMNWVDGDNFDGFNYNGPTKDKYSYAFVVMPGGMGTLDELFEALTLIQTGKIKGFPVVLFGKDYWNNLLKMLDTMLEQKTIASNDLELFLVTDDIQEAMEHIKRYLP